MAHNAHRPSNSTRKHMSNSLHLQPYIDNTSEQSRVLSDRAKQGHDCLQHCFVGQFPSVNSVTCAMNVILAADLLMTLLNRVQLS